MPDAGLPRPLTPFERYMVLDDRPGYRMTFLVQVDFDGVFERDRLQRAVCHALERHPMLRTTTRRGRTWRTPMPARDVATVHWLPWTANPPKEGFVPIDLTREAGTRFFAQEQDGRMRWLVQAHHAVTDGQGVAQFCWDVARAYAADSATSTTQADATDATPTVVAPVPADTAAPHTAPGSRMPSASEALGFLMHRPARVRGTPPSAALRRAALADQLVPTALTHVFDDAAFARLRAAAGAHAASVNDLFLAALLQVLAEWNRPAAPYAGSDWLRVMVPTTLRTRHHAALGATNAVGYAFLDRRMRDCGDTRTLIAGVHDEMRAARVNRVGAQIVGGMALADRVPALLGLILRAPLTLASVVFTNLGRAAPRIPGPAARDADALGPHLPRITHARGIMPLRPGTRAGFVLLRLRHTLVLTLRTDPQYLDQEAASALLSAYVARMESITQSLPAT